MAIQFAPKLPEPIAQPVRVKGGRKGIGGRPKKDDAKVLVSLRVDPEVLGYYRGLGEDWRLQMAAVLRKGAGL